MYYRIFISENDDHSWFVGIDKEGNIIKTDNIRYAKIIEKHNIIYLLNYLKKITLNKNITFKEILI